MNPELRSYIEHARYIQIAPRGAIPLLPADDVGEISNAGSKR